MRLPAPAKFYLPAIFALVIGIGNVIVGESRVTQYELVLSDLSELSRRPPEERSSTLNRIQALPEGTDRRAQRVDRAVAKRDFYRLVSYGGKVLTGVGLMLLSFSLFIAMRSELRVEGEERSIE